MHTTELSKKIYSLTGDKRLTQEVVDVVVDAHEVELGRFVNEVRERARKGYPPVGGKVSAEDYYNALQGVLASHRGGNTK